MEDAMPSGSKDVTLSLPAELAERMEAAASAEGKTPDEWMAEALQKKLLDEKWQRMGIQAEERRRKAGFTHEQAQAHVDRLIHEHRAERGP
jgi:predicted transcriptional regulator